MGKSLSSDSARVVRRSSKKKHRDVQRRTRGSASLPAPAKKLGPIISTVHTNDSTLTRNKGLLISPLLELFLDRSDVTPNGWTLCGFQRTHPRVLPQRCLRTPGKCFHAASLPRVDSLRSLRP